jgi:hypothetical protein
VRLPDAVEARRLVAVVMIATSTMVAGRLVVSSSADLVARDFGRPNFDYDFATALQTMGARRGDTVGIIGLAYDAYWARLAGMRVVADLPLSEVLDFWSQTPETRASVYAAFGRAGVRLIVADSVPRSPAAEGWREVGQSGRFAYFLERASD